MSTIIDFSIFPLDKEESVSPYVARAVKVIKNSGLDYRMSPMGTSIEGEWEDLAEVIGQCLHELQQDCRRVIFNVKGDYRKGASGRMGRKVASVEDKL